MKTTLVKLQTGKQYYMSPENGKEGIINGEEVLGHGSDGAVIQLLHDQHTEVSR